MKRFFCFAAAIIAFLSCTTLPDKAGKKETGLAVEGTWKLISGTLIEKNDTVITEYSGDKSFIKVLGATHFAFMGHDLSKGKDPGAFYTSGGGKYELNDSAYTEHLEYCSDRQWEGNDFHFTITIANDTLVQQGIEKIDSIGVDRLNIEKYVRMK